MPDKGEFDSKAFLKKAYNLRKYHAEPNRLGNSDNPTPRNVAPKRFNLQRSVKGLFVSTAKRILKPFTAQLRSRILGDMETEMNYFHSNQNKVNRELREEMREIRKLLEERRMNE